MKVIHIILIACGIETVCAGLLFLFAPKMLELAPLRFWTIASVLPATYLGLVAFGAWMMKRNAIK